MTVEPIGIAILLIGLISINLNAAFIVYVFVSSTLLGSAGAVILDSLGGTNIQPAHILLGFLTIRLLADNQIARRAFEGVAFPHAGFWLMLTLFYSLVTSYMMPRLFYGQVFVFPVRASDPYQVLLEPSSSNITQSVYFVGNFICFVTCLGYAGSTSGYRRLARAIIACATLNLFFAALDLVTYYTGTSEVLSFMRNAKYSLMTDGETAGFKRIVGSFTETSTFSFTTLGYFGYASALWLRGVWPRLTLTISLLSLTALLFSTSTTAYVGLVIFAGIQYVQIATRSATSQTSAQVAYLVGLPIILCLLVLAVALNEGWSSYASGLIDQFVLSKMSTDSGIERSSWNRQAIQSVFDTLGFGVGNGSLRASSFPVALISSLGVAGALLYCIFLLQLWFGQSRGGFADATDAKFSQAAKSACLGWLIPASVSGGLIDLGLPFFIAAALAVARPAAAFHRPGPQPERFRSTAQISSIR